MQDVRRHIERIKAKKQESKERKIVYRKRRKQDVRDLTG